MLLMNLCFDEHHQLVPACLDLLYILMGINQWEFSKKNRGFQSEISNPDSSSGLVVL